jgi:uncharacterized RDD family membrane protein YckC
MNTPVNPYESPTVAVASNQNEFDAVPMVPAHRGLRLANLVIDQVAQSIVGFGVGVLIVTTWGEEGATWIDETPGLFFGVPILLGYYFAMEATTSRTIGKLLTGTRVVSSGGGPPTTGQILGRTFSRLIPFEAFTFLKAGGRGLHDTLPKTYVVKVR